MGALALISATAACSDDPPVVARGRYVELATHRSDPVCAGTMAYMDVLIEVGFDLLGESPPEGVFVRYEWFDPEDHPPLIPTGHAQQRGDEIHILSNRIVHEHELVHAIHQRVWPRSAQFMEEGLATLLDAKRAHGQGLFGWPESVEIDDVLASTSLDPTGYHHAWLIVSQIVFEHGIDGLRDLWHAIPKGASAQQVRDAYERMFGQPIDTLIEPYSVDAYGATHWIERRACSLALCPSEGDELLPWNGDVWTASGPTDCEDDPLAVGPLTTPSSLGIGSVWRPYTVEFPEGDRELRPDEPRGMHPHDVVSEGGVGATLEPCWLNCADVATASVQPDSTWSEWTWGPGRFRVEVLAELDDLPRDPPGELHIQRNEP